MKSVVKIVKLGKNDFGNWAIIVFSQGNFIWRGLVNYKDLTFKENDLITDNSLYLQVGFTKSGKTTYQLKNIEQLN